ncbi:MAG: serine/threonine protein kinase, partial [Anaerolineae bacterium]|nr:serine/threonine protein kinase [Anaerolineae bacterium]
MTDDLIGKQIGGYEIQDVIGKGGMATVYKAHQVSMNRTVAVKVLPEQYINDDTYLQRFNQEVAIVAKLEHRNIVPVHDYGEYNGRPYIVMRYMAGGSVDDKLRDGPLEVEHIVNIIEQIAPALDYAHGKNVLHRDLKPSNVLLDDDGGAYLTDFGIARVLGEQAASGITTQGVVGTPSYMSPEQAQGLPLDGRSDIYALGVMLFELATGRRPFEGDTPYGIAVMHVTTPPPSPRTYNPALSFAIEEVIYKTLRKKREERCPNAVAV